MRARRVRESKRELHKKRQQNHRIPDMKVMNVIERNIDVRAHAVAIWIPLKWQDAPALAVAWGALISGILKGAAWISLVTNEQSLPFGPVKV